MSKNIEMQELTSNRYEPLYPKTSTAQINGIENYDWQIGDIRSTARTDLGDKWLLCNGSVIDTSDEYSEVGDLLGKNAGSWVLEDTVDKTKIFSSALRDVNIEYKNNKYLAMGTEYVMGTSSYSYKVKIAYSDSLTGNWIETYLPIPTGVSPQNIQNSGITFFNQKYYAGAIIFVSQRNYIAVIWSTVDLNNWGIEYTSGNLSWGSCDVGKITASSNKIVIPVFCYAEINFTEYRQFWVVQMSTTDNAWNMRQLYSESYSNWNYGNFQVSVANDNLFITCWVRESSTQEMNLYSTYQFIFNSISAREWSRSTFLGPDSSGMNRGVTSTSVSNVIYFNGSYYIVGAHTFSGYNDATTTGYGDLYVSTSVSTGTMTWNLSSTEGKNVGSPCGLVKNGVYYIFYTNGKYSKMETLSSDLSKAIAIDGVAKLSSLSFLSNSQFINVFEPFVKCKTMEWTSILPNITVDKGYVYIKAKN